MGAAPPKKHLLLQFSPSSPQLSLAVLAAMQLPVRLQLQLQLPSLLPLR